MLSSRGMGSRYSFIPASPITFAISSLALAGASAKEMRVGGTSICSKVPLMLSLAADRAQAEADLRVQRAEQRGQRDAPALGVVVEAHEVFLEGQRIASKSQPAATSFATEATML